jgi:hypothetical protein
MENLSRGGANHLSARLLVILGLLAASALFAPAAVSGDSPDLAGTWHVLVHYKDDNAPHSERERWEDRVWVFEKTGSRLRWTDYPIVVFDDQSGRFDRSLGRSSRVLEFWEPSSSQLADIKDGLAVNERGMKSKTLKNSDGNWASFSRNTAASASVISYVEHWSIDSGDTGPIFRREDVLGSERSEDLDGVTLYTTTVIGSEDGSMSGSFERDGSRHGTFKMTRSGATEGLKSDGKTPNEKANERGRRALEALGYVD